MLHPDFEHTRNLAADGLQPLQVDVQGHVISPSDRGRESDVSHANFSDGRLPAQTSIIHQSISPGETKTVRVDQSHDFVFVARQDKELVVRELSARIANHHRLPEGSVREAVAVAYEEFSELVLLELARALRDPLAHRDSPDSLGKIEVHVIEGEPLIQGVRELAQGLPVISLDPLMQDNVHELAVSRLFYVGGTRAIGLTHRPGSEPLEIQCDRLRARLAGQPVMITDDDLYTGGTLRDVLQMLDFPVQGAIPQIQTGHPEFIKSLGMSISPVVLYEIHDRKKFDIGDVRDFLLGVSGLVVELPSGQHGRLPYMLPFVSPAARASVHLDNELEFSKRILDLNARFYTDVERRLGITLRVRDLDPSVHAPLDELFGYLENAPIRSVIENVSNRVQPLWESVRRIGAMQSRLANLQLPQRCVLLDVNGTLIPDNLTSAAEFETRQLQALQQEVARLSAAGISVGLCSDSPLPQLQALAQQLQLSGPILAENGNLISFQGRTEVIRTLPGHDQLVELIRSYAGDSLVEVAPAVSPEFGGSQPRFNAKEWAFGADRQASISVFGPHDFIDFLGKSLSRFDGYTIDCSPEHNFLGIHVGSDFRRNKGETLRTLASFGYSLLMVGNSASDWVSPESGVQCAFVGNARIPDEARQAAVYVAKVPCLAGTIEILSNVQTEPPEGM